MSFFFRLSTSARKHKSLLCIGLDPRVSNEENAAAGIVELNRRVIDTTLPYAAAYKPNMAFYECYGSAGLDALSETLDMIPDDVPVILDAKRNDIGSTAEAYAKAVFEHFGADAVTLNAYMGRDSVDPFLSYTDRGLFLLCKTSNAGGNDFQTLTIRENGEEKPLYIKIARTVCAWSDEIGLVVGGNDIDALSAVRSVLPEVWILAPGIGAQGGSIPEAVAAGIRSDGLGILPHVSRSIANADDPGAAAKKMRDDLNEAREKTFEASTGSTFSAGSISLSQNENGPVIEKNKELKESLLSGLLDAGCFRIGEFVLKSGMVSPFYIDLRRIGSNPSLLKLAAAAYASMAENLEFDRVAGIPVAGLPLATALCLEIQTPLLIPRPERKDHGTGNAVEGDFKPGERVLLLDDLITTGGAKIEAADVLRGEGLRVEHLTVLLERGAKGREEVEASGIKLHAFAHIDELLELCDRRGMLDNQTRKRIETFLGR